MTEVVMRDATCWRGQGGPQVEIDAELIEWLESSRANDKVLEVPSHPDNPDAQELIRQSRIYARRKGLSFTHQFAHTDSGIVLRFRLRAKRPYTKKKVTS